MIRRALQFATLAGLASRAPAQNPSFTDDTDLRMLPAWTEFGGNHNGLLEPGESAAITIAVSFTNQFGRATFLPPQGTFTSGTILGFGSGFLDLLGTGGTQGAFNFSDPANTGPAGYGVLEGWRIIGPASNGSVNAAGTGIVQIQFGQFPGSPAAVNTANPIATMYRALWTPTTYSHRTVTFTVATGSATGAVYVQLDAASGVQVYVRLTHTFPGSINIPIVPAPASLAALALAPLLWAPRRRTGRSRR